MVVGDTIIGNNLSICAFSSFQAFDMVKDELRITRQRNANRLRNLQHDGEIGERAAAVKREAEAGKHNYGAHLSNNPSVFPRF